MEPKNLRGSKKPETLLQNEIIKFLRYKEWFVKSTHGNMFQSGFPDLYCCHINYGPRWIEVKMPVGYKFTKDQLETFPRLEAAGAGVWVLTAATHEEYDKLFKPSNWINYLDIWKGRRN